MNIKKIKKKAKLLCSKCPYTLGLVIYVDSPCPICMLNNFQTYYTLIEGKYKTRGVGNIKKEINNLILKDTR